MGEAGTICVTVMSNGADALKHAVYFFIFVVNAFGIGLKTAIENKVGMLQWDTFLMMECTN